MHKIIGARAGVLSWGLASAALISAFLVASSSSAADQPRFFDLSRFQVFVVNWEPQDKPFCALLHSDADWKRVLHPAPHMGFNNPFAPPADYWRDHDLAVMSQVVSVEDVLHVYKPTKAELSGRALQVRFERRPQNKSSYEIKANLAVALNKNQARSVEFVEDGKRVCAYPDAPSRSQK